MNYFFKDESPMYKGMIIRPNFDKLPLTYTDGSYSVLLARILGLDWIFFLKFSQDIGAIVIGKDHLYPCIYYKDGEKLDRLIEILNERAGRLLERDSENE